MSTNTLIENAYQKAYAATLMSADVPTCFGQQPEREDSSRFSVYSDYHSNLEKQQALKEAGYAVSETRVNRQYNDYEHFTWTQAGLEHAHGLGFTDASNDEKNEGMPWNFVEWQEIQRLTAKATERARLEAAQLAKCANCLFFSQCAVISGKFKRASYGGDY